MSVVTWSELDKSQSDSQKIGAAIDAAISAHEADENAHLGVGESLEAHKSEDILDHPVGSVLADKLTLSEELFECSFESLDNWSKTGTVDSNGWPGARLYVEYGAVNESKLYTLVQHSGNWLDYAKNVLFQFIAYDSISGNHSCYFVIGNFVSSSNIDGFGFEFVNGVVKGLWGKGSSITRTSEISVDETKSHIFRAQYDAVDKNVKFYVDGVLVATIADISPTGGLEPDIYFSAVASSGSDGYLHIRKVGIAREE